MNATTRKLDNAERFVEFARRMLIGCGLVPELMMRSGTVRASLMLRRSRCRIEFHVNDLHPKASLTLVTPHAIRLHAEMEAVPVFLLRLNGGDETGRWALWREESDDRIVCISTLDEGQQTTLRTFESICRAMTERVDLFLSRLQSASWNRHQHRSGGWT